MIAKIGQTLDIGLHPEHNARTFDFDISKWLALWPEATANVIIERPGEKVSYPAVSEMDGSVIRWTVTRYDTEKTGVGRMWVAFTDGDKLLGLTPATRIVISDGPDMVDGDTPVSDTPPWIQQVLDAIANFKPGEGGSGTPGEDGATFFPSMSEDGTLSWTNDKGLENPEPVNIKGPIGPTGAQGPKGDPARVHTNLLHNADFTQFVAQAGIAQSHAGSADIYAGDRWILSSGAVTAEADENGNGYKRVVLDGVMRQKVAMPPENGYAYVRTISGEASAVYADGVVTITGIGAELDIAWLYDEDDDNTPARRGYTAELMDCCRYYIYFPASNALSYGGFAQSSTEARFTMPLPIPMRLGNPTYRIQWRTTMQMYPGAVTPEAINSVTVTGNTASISLKSSGLTTGTVMTLKTNAIIELCADL